MELERRKNEQEKDERTGTEMQMEAIDHSLASTVSSEEKHSSCSAWNLLKY